MTALLTATTEFTDEAWHEIAVGIGEFEIDASRTARTAYTAPNGTAPAKSVLGTLRPEHVPFVVVLAASTSLWIKSAVQLRGGGVMSVNITPAQ